MVNQVQQSGTFTHTFIPSSLQLCTRLLVGKRNLHRLHSQRRRNPLCVLRSYAPVQRGDVGPLCFYTTKMCGIIMNSVAVYMYERIPLKRYDFRPNSKMKESLVPRAYEDPLELTLLDGHFALRMGEAKLLALSIVRICFAARPLRFDTTP